MRPTNMVSLRKARWGAGIPASSRTARVRCQTLPNSTCASVTCGQPRFVWLGGVLLGRCRGTIVRGPSTPLSTDCVQRAGILHEGATVTTRDACQQTGAGPWGALDETGTNSGVSATPDRRSMDHDEGSDDRCGPSGTGCPAV